MRNLKVFNHVSLDGYFVGHNGDFSWAQSGNDDRDYSEWVAGNAGVESLLLFGRFTYELMASYWPTPIADQHDPALATLMNSKSKVVFSRTLEKASWSNTTLVKGDLLSEIRKMKNEPGPDMVILGSGTVVAQLATAHLIDEYQMVLDPVALGTGRTMFEGIRENLYLKLAKTRTFNNGKIFLSFVPAL